MWLEKKCNQSIEMRVKCVISRVDVNNIEIVQTDLSILKEHHFTHQLQRERFEQEAFEIESFETIRLNLLQTFAKI